MKKIHTKAKRKAGLSTHRGKIPTGRKKKGPKTFKTEATANEWAKENKIEKFSLKKVKKGKKFQIVKS